MSEEKKTETLPPKGFIANLVEQWLKDHPDARPAEVYKRMGISKHNFSGCRNSDREIGPRYWPRWRKGLGMSHREFWKLAQKFYDP